MIALEEPARVEDNDSSLEREPANHSRTSSILNRYRNNYVSDSLRDKDTPTTAKRPVQAFNVVNDI